MSRFVLWCLAIVLVVWAILSLFDILAVGGSTGTIVIFVLAVILIFGAMRPADPPPATRPPSTKPPSA